MRRTRLWILFLLLLALLVAVPASAELKRGKGLLSTITCAASATCTSDDFAPAPGHQLLAVFTNSTQAGTARVYRVDSRGVEHAQAAAASVSAGVENIQVFQYPLARMHVVFVNSSTITAATVRVEVDDGSLR